MFTYFLILYYNSALDVNVFANKTALTNLCYNSAFVVNNVVISELAQLKLYIETSVGVVLEVAYLFLLSLLKGKSICCIWHQNSLGV